MQTGRVHVLLQKLPPLAPLSDRARPSLLSYLYLVSVGFASVLSDLIFRLPPFAVSVSVSGRSSVSGCSPSVSAGSGSADMRVAMRDADEGLGLPLSDARALVCGKWRHARCTHSAEPSIIDITPPRPSE